MFSCLCMHLYRDTLLVSLPFAGNLFGVTVQHKLCISQNVRTHAHTRALCDFSLVPQCRRNERRRRCRHQSIANVPALQHHRSARLHKHCIHSRMQRATFTNDTLYHIDMQTCRTDIHANASNRLHVTAYRSNRTLWICHVHKLYKHALVAGNGGVIAPIVINIIDTVCVTIQYM